jgi:hypothetical protein
MLPRRVLSVCLLSGWLLAGIVATPAFAQPLGPEPLPGRIEDPAPYRTPMYGRAPGGASLPGRQIASGPALGGEFGIVEEPAGTSSTGLFPPHKAPEATGVGGMRIVNSDRGAGTDSQLNLCETWGWELLPNGLMYSSYLAGGREPRIASQWVNLRDRGWVWDTALGARVGLLRYGTLDDPWPEGWQFDMEGAVFPRLDLEAQRQLVANDYRVGGGWTFRRGVWEGKFSYYHLCAHLGDEFRVTHPEVNRINYVRDVLVIGLAIRPWRDLRLYSEAGYAVYRDGGAKPWEFQFGAEYSSVEPTGARGSPFVAANAHLRQENDFSGNIALQAGWQWRGYSGHLFRVGAQYFNGMSDQYQFFARAEDQVGVGMWYDF